MAVDMFLKISGIPGESVDSKHKNEIDVLSFSWGVDTRTQQTSAGRVTRTGKAALQDFSFVKYVDGASPALFVSACQGEHIPEAQFALARKAGENQQEYYKITLKDVLVSSVRPCGSSGGTMPAFEEVSLSFGSAEIAAADATGQFASRTVCGGSLSLEPEPPVLVDGVTKK